MAVEARYQAKLNITQDYDTTAAGGGSSSLNNDNQKTLTAASTPPTTEADVAEKAMVAGVATLDLTSFTSLRGRSLNLTGLKLRLAKIKAPSTNGAAVTISKGASNGFTGFGAAFSLTLQPGQEVAYDDAGHASSVAVSASVKTLDLAGTTTDKIQIAFAAGA